jgi:hypothetical protein
MRFGNGADLHKVFIPFGNVAVWNTLGKLRLETASRAWASRATLSIPRGTKRKMHIPFQVEMSARSYRSVFALPAVQSAIPAQQTA